MPRTDFFGPRLIDDVARRVFPRFADIVVEPVEEGVSTYVYRIRRAGEIYYLRVLPEEGASFVPEAQAHTLLRSRGARVPDVVYVDACDVALGRSVMVTTEIVGRHVGHCRDRAEARRALAAAARDLVIVNSIPVEGFGWIERYGAPVGHLMAEHPTYREFALDHLEDNLALLGMHALNPRETAAIGEAIERHDSLLDVADARLAHGDFDATHIFQQDGRYTGIIDFGEIRGADLFYDLGHFALHDGETLPFRALPYLLEGYRDVTLLPPDYEQRLHLASLLIGVKALARQLGKPPHARGRTYLAWLSAFIQTSVKTLQND